MKTMTISPYRYRYRAFGLRIASSAPLPELPPITGIPDVSITVGYLPAGLTAAAAEETPLPYVAPGEYLRRHREFGGYHVRQGREITLAPEFLEYRTDGLKPIQLLEIVFIHLWLQRGALGLHAGSVNIGGRAAVFMGEGGSGKSTTTATLAGRGHDKLADDISLIAFAADGAPLVVPSCTGQNLPSESLEMLGLDPRGADKLPGEDKYAFPLLSESHEPVPLGCIYHLCPEDRDEIGLMPLKGFDKFVALSSNVQQGETATQMFPQGGKLINRLTALGKSTAMARINRPRRRACLSELAAVVEGDFEVINCRPY